MLIGLWPFIATWWKNRSKPEKYVDQPIIESYRDFELVGQWHTMCLTGCCIERGGIYAETVKFKCRNGKVAVGIRLVPDNSREFRGFE